MQLLRNLVHIKRDEADEMFKDSVLHKPDNLKVKPTEGKVIGTGPTCTQVKVGDLVLYGRYAAQDMDDTVLVHEDDILAVL